MRIAATLSGVLILALLAGGLTEATLAVGHRNGISDDNLLRPRARQTKSPAPTTAPSAAPSQTPSPSPTPSPTPTATPAGPTATTNGFVHMRAGKSTSTAILTDLQAGTTVQLLSDSDAQWQQVQYNGFTGYIFKSYLHY
jgi:uncharacterized protein YgiM (DUF1202 family)